MTALWLFLRAISPRTWLVSLAIAAAVSAGAYARHWHISAVDAARRDVRDSIASAARTVQPAQKETVYVASRRTDDAVGSVQRQTARVRDAASTVDAKAAAIPTPMRTQPVIELIDAAHDLTDKARVLGDSVRTLNAAVITERTAREALRVTSDQIVVTLRDSLHVEQARPKRTWKSNTLLTLGGALAGAAITLITSH